jgi:hypothetical protein
VKKLRRLKQFHLFRAGIRAVLRGGFGTDGNARIKRRFEKRHPVVSERIHLGEGCGARDDQDLGCRTACIPKPTDNVPLGYLPPMKPAVLLGPFSEPACGYVNGETALALPPAQPFAARKPTPEDALKPRATPDRDQSSRPVLGSRGFKGGAHRVGGLAGVPNRHPFCHVFLDVLHSSHMGSPPFSHGTDPQKKGPQAVEVPVEVLGAEEQQGAPENTFSSRRVPPQGTGQARDPAGKSAAFRSMTSLAVGVAADALEVAFPPAWLLIDAVATVSFFLIWGLRWEIAVVLLPEIVPGMNVFPSWTLLAFYLEKKGSGNA